MSWSVVFSERAEHQLDEIFRYIEGKSGTQRADSFVSSIVAYCESFETFPERGTSRDDLRPGLRVIGYQRRVTIVFTLAVEEVAILGVYYGGQNYEADLSET